MSQDLIIEMTPFGARTALMRHGDLLEVRFADHDVADIRGQVFLARVKAIDAERDAAFVDCGRGQTAYLAGRDGRYLGGGRSDLPLVRQITQGEAIMVQGSGMSRDGKKARVTSDIQLTGMFQIFRPRRHSVKLSSRLSETGQSDRLFNLAKTTFSEGGVIYRGAAGAAADDELQKEAEQLKAAWAAIEARAKDAQAPTCLFDRKDPLERILHEALKPDVDRIVAADRIVFAATRKFIETWLPALAPRLECQPGAFDINGVNDQLDEANQPRVELKSGGDIVIEHTEALTAIDVNAGPQRNADANLEAAEEIARQLRLRRIGGIIVVDFIDLASQSERTRLLETLDEAFADDPAAVKIVPPSPLGLVQISRQRLGHSLAERLGRPCPTCTGSGRTASLQSATERLLGELTERQDAVAETIRVAVDLYAYLAADAAEPFKTFIDRHALPTPLLTPDESLPPAAYRLTA